MTESKRIDNLRIKIAQCVEDKLAQDEKSSMRCNTVLQKQTTGVIFNVQNS